MLISVLMLLSSLTGLNTPAHVPDPAGTVTVAVANLREGGVDRAPVDVHDPTDMRAFAARLLGRPGRVPDVLLVQEVLGSAGSVARTLNEQAEAGRSAAHYVPVTATRHRYVRGRCQGLRAGRFSVLRGAAVLANTATVTDVLDRGTVRTWGRWAEPGRPVVGRGGYGCTEHPWVRLRIRHAGRTPVTALVASVHVAPTDTRLKNRAVTHLDHALAAVHQPRLDDVEVVGGDLNLTRCRQDLLTGEPRHCPMRAGHRAFAATGLVDAVRSEHPAGKHGVLGVGRRIDFAYTPDVVRGSWFDRCYLGFLVRRGTCGGSGPGFVHPTQFYRCQTRALKFGRPDGSCPAPVLARYYSDHPMLTVTVSPRAR